MLQLYCTPHIVYMCNIQCVETQELYTFYQIRCGGNLWLSFMEKSQEKHKKQEWE